MSEVEFPKKNEKKNLISFSKFNQISPLVK